MSATPTPCLDADNGPEARFRPSRWHFRQHEPLSLINMAVSPPG